MTVTLALVLAGCSSTSSNASCEQTGIEKSDYQLDFTIPDGLMPDNQFAGEQAHLRVHRVSPVYAGEGCASRSAMVLVHGRGLGGSVAFDLDHKAAGGDPLSLQEALARGGIDTFAPDLLGYGESSRLSLDDPGNASLPTDITRNHRAFPLDQQRTELWTNPLNGAFKPHSSSTYFGNTDVWARDVSQVIDDAITKSGHSKVALLAGSFGGPVVGRTVHVLGDEADDKLSHLVFEGAIFDTLPGPTGPITTQVPLEEKDLPPAQRATSFPMLLIAQQEWDNLIPGRDEVCEGRVAPGSLEALHEQAKTTDAVGAGWGGTAPGEPTGVVRAPTFSLSGWNQQVAAAITVPTLVIHGLDDSWTPVVNSVHLYDALTVENKALVHLECAGHLMHYETAASWAGPHRAVADAVIEWVTSTTYNGETSGVFTVDRSGMVAKNS